MGPVASPFLSRRAPPATPAAGLSLGLMSEGPHAEVPVHYLCPAMAPALLSAAPPQVPCSQVSALGAGTQAALWTRVLSHGVGPTGMCV